MHQIFDEIRLAELRVRNVDGHAEVLVADILQTFEELQCAAGDPVANRYHQAGLFGERNEAIRRDELIFIGSPADQCFGTDDAAAGQIDKRLVDEVQMVGGEGKPQAAQHLHPFAGSDGVFGNEIDGLAAVEVLGLLQGHAGVFE